ncbi:MAG: isoprenyl transferase [Balneolales bacterium]|nr:isoprenyl transferase [Balneolales bacterium]
MEKIAITNKKQTKEDILRQSLLKERGQIPEHVAIIMDGNGRWAKERGKMRIQGHKAGVDSVRDSIEACAQLGVGHLTLYAFSTENWRRPKTEVSALMKLLIQTLRKETINLNKNDIRLNAIGELERLPSICLNELKEGMEMTKDNQRMVITLALSYSGRWDINNAVREIAQKFKSGEISADAINDDLIRKHLATAEIPDPDLLIRTGGDFRISNFLLWQCAYTEFFITNKYWPDFRRDQIYEAIEAYQTRERRFGMISEQLYEQQKTQAKATA